MSFEVEEVQILLKLDKSQFVNLINTVLKNIGSTEFLSEDADKKRMEEVFEYLCELEFNQYDFINNKNDNLFYDSIANQMQNDTWQNEQYKSVNIMCVDYKSDNDIIIKLWDSMASYAKYFWLSMTSDIDCKECIIDEMGVEYTKWVEYVWHEGTHFIRKENGNIHYDYYPAENYHRLMEEGVHPVHFAESIFYDLYNELHTIYIYLGGAEENQYIELCNEIKQQENEIEAMKQKVEKILGKEISRNIYEPKEKIIDELFRQQYT